MTWLKNQKTKFPQGSPFAPKYTDPDKTTSEKIGEWARGIEAKAPEFVQNYFNKFREEEKEEKKDQESPSPTKHLVDAKGKPKGKGHISKHKAGHWGPEGHGDRSASGIAAGAINKGKKVVKDVKKLVEDTKSKID